MQIRTGDAARSEPLISEPKTRVRPQAAASAQRAHPVTPSLSRPPSPELESKHDLKAAVLEIGGPYGVFGKSL
jgi:hypothetical protein